VLSALAVATRLPSALKRATPTLPLCRRAGTSSSPLSALQIRTVLSSPHVRTRPPSGLSETSRTGPACCYWIPLFELLKARGFEVFLVDPRQSRHAPGRPKSNVLDCQWLQRLHSYGLLTASFRPADQVVVLRSGKGKC
jgi:hypothetical protein